MLTQARLCELFDYDEVTGNLVWKICTSRRVRVGSIAGYVRWDNYRHIRIDGQLYLAHRLVWLWHHGKFPDHEIDHIDRNPANNRIENLRDVAASVNLANRRARAGSGYKGAYPSGKRWQAKIAFDGNVIRLGSFDTAEQAHDAFKAAHVAVYGINSEYFKEAA